MSGAYEAIADKAAGAKDAVAGAVSSVGDSVHMPELNLYLEPIHPAADLSVKDRAQLVLQSARPWSDFFNISMFNIPPMSEYKLRLQTNVETFFYNYFLLALIYLVVFSFGHFPSVLALVGVLAVAFCLYVLHPEPMYIGSLEFGAPAKHAVVIALSLLALTVGHVLTLIFSLAVFLFIVVGIHASIREHTA